MRFHRAEPGPAYWDWRCMRCGANVRDHARFGERLVARWREWRGRG